jgi:hypothetical protein
VIGDAAVEHVDRAQAQNPGDDGVSQLDLKERDFHRERFISDRSNTESGCEAASAGFVGFK